MKFKMACELTDFFVMLQLWRLVKVTVQACDPPCLYFSAGRVIKSIELSSQTIASNVTQPQAHDGRVLAVAVDVEENTLYFSDQVSRTIKRIDLKSSKIEDVASGVGRCEDMAIDWVNKYIYWTDNKNGRIEMSRVNGSDRKLLFDRDVQYLRGITVDPVHGYMFWTDYGDNPKIERAALAGQERTTIIANTIITRLKYPNGVIVDYTSNRIYWVDAGLSVIGTADQEGRNIKISEPIKDSRLFALALYNNTLYITDSKMNAKSIIVVDKESLREISRFTQSMIGSRDLLGLTMLHESRQPPVISPCSHGNGGCSHLCFIVPDGYRCGCPNGTALREDGYSCQEANFTNCRNQPCQNGGTCYFNFQRFADDCTCSKYYAERDCGLYLGAGAVGVTLEMNVEEWEKEKFKKAIMGGLDDYCKGDNCGMRNESISKQFCPCFLNNSARLNATQVAVIGQPVASLPKRTKVDFAVILRPVSSSKPLVVVNTTLQHIIWERANFISKHFNKIVLVNNLHPSSDTGCMEKEDKTKSKNNAKTSSVVILLVSVFAVVAVVVAVVAVVAVWYRRNRCILPNQLEGNDGEEIDDRYEFVPPAEPRENQQRDNNGEGNDGGYEFDPQAEQRDDNRDGNDGGDEVVPRGEQRGNNRDGNDGGYEFVPRGGQRGNNRDGNDGGHEFDPLAEQRDNGRDENDGGSEFVPLAEQRDNNRDGNDGGNEFVPLVEQRGNGRDANDGGNEFVPLAEQRGNQQGGNNGEGNNDRHRIVIDKDINNWQGSFDDVNRDIVDNRKRENLNIPGNQHRETCNEQQLEEAYEDMNASQARATSQESFESATARHPIENDDDASGTYTNPVQCTDDIIITH